MSQPSPLRHVGARRHPAPVLIALGIVASGSVSAVGAPVGRITAGWPVHAPAEATLHRGTDGGPVVLSDGLGNSLAAALTPKGVRRWTTAFGWGCGNCAVLQPDASLPTGPYGPLGPSGLRFVSATGASLPKSDAILADGTRITTTPGQSAGDPTVTAATRGAVSVWSRPDPFPQDTFETSGGFVVTDGTSLYRGFGSTSTPTIALNPANGFELWRVQNAYPLTPFGSGVVVALAGGDLAGYSAAGVKLFQLQGVTWSAPPLVDVLRHRIYVNSNSGLRAFDTTTSALVWSRSGATALSVTPGGLVLAAISVGGHPALQAIGADGIGRWRHETSTTVRSALRLPDGTVALSVDGVGTMRDAGLLMRINPKVKPALPIATTITLTKTHFKATCGDASTACGLSAVHGTMLRVSSRSRTTMSVRVLWDTGALMARWTKVSVPVGTSFTAISAAAHGGRIQVRSGTTGPIILDRRITVTA